MFQRMAVRIDESGAALFQAERRGHDFQPAIHLAQPVAVWDSDIGIEGYIGALIRIGIDRRYFDPRRIHRHQEHGDALMLGRLGVGAGQEQNIGSKVRPAGPHFLAVDHPVITVPHGTGFGGKYVGA